MAHNTFRFKIVGLMFGAFFRWLVRLHRPAGLGLAAALLTLLLGSLFYYEGIGYARFSSPPWEILLLRGEMTAGNFLRHHGRPVPTRQDIVFLGIDDATLTLDGLWPEEIEASPALKLMKQSKDVAGWSREVFGLLLDRLADAGARLVIFDLVFPNSFQGDDVFRTALEHHRGQVAIGLNFKLAPGGDDAPVLPAASLIPEPANDPRIGYVNYDADFDGAIRLAMLSTTMTAHNGRAPQPGEPVYRSLVGASLNQLGHGDLLSRWPGKQLFRYTASPRTDYPPHPLWEIFSDASWKANYQEGSFFKNKIVMVGAAAPTLHDIQPTPYGDIPGPDLHLQVLTAALAQDFLTMTNVWTDFALILGAGMLAWGAGLYVKAPLARLGAFLLTSVAFLAITQWLYNHFGLIPLIFTPLLVFNLGGLSGLIGEYAVERVEKFRVRGVLDRLVSKDIVQELLSDRARYDQIVRGQRRPVTVLFSDVRGFSTLSEAAADPAAFVFQLNEYLGEMVDVVFKHQGTLDKFIGDAVMAVWGSMRTEGAETDACKAVAAAVEMRGRLAALNARWAAEGKLQLAIGIGLNYGEVIVGGLGSERTKMEITVMGDAVNTASRLEGLTKEYGLDLLVGESVAVRVSEHFRLRSVDRVRVKGKKKPTEVMTVLGSLEDTPPYETEELLADYEDAVLLYRHQNFTAAARMLEGCLRIDPQDALSSLYLTRCQELLAEAPAASWDGVRVMTTK